MIGHQQQRDPLDPMKQSLDMQDKLVWDPSTQPGDFSVFARKNEVTKKEPEV